MADIAVHETYRATADNKAWVYADISKQAGRRTVTLDLSKFTEAVHYKDGYIRSGEALGKITATGKYGPFDKDATDGREVFDGFLWTFADVRPGQEISINAIWDGPGTIRENKLPRAAAAELKTSVAAHGRFKFVTA